MSIISIFIGCCLSVAYIVRVLLFDDTIGPFQSKKIFVQDGVNNGTSADPADLWDRVRWLFGAYRVEDIKDGLQVWHTTQRTDVWRCPKCLSFWVAFLMSVPFTFYTGEVVMFPITHLSVTFIAQFLVFTQLRIEGTDDTVES